MVIKEEEVIYFEKFIGTLYRLGIVVEIKCTMQPFLYQQNYTKVYEITRRNDES